MGVPWVMGFGISHLCVKADVGIYIDEFIL